MLPDHVSNPGPLTYESGALPIALLGPACLLRLVVLLYKLSRSQLCGQTLVAKDVCNCFLNSVRLSGRNIRAK